MVRDAALCDHDVAVIVSNDTDLLGAVEAVRKDFGKRVVQINPANEANLKARRSRYAEQVDAVIPMIFDSSLKNAQLPSRIELSAGRFATKPTSW